MMRSPYQSPTEAPKQRFLRRRPIEPHGKGRWVLAGIGVVAAYLVYTFVFNKVLEAKSPNAEPYALFLFCGLLPWTWFATSLTESAGVLISGGNLIKKVLFPAEILPIVSVLANMMHFLLGLPILGFFLVYYDKPLQITELARTFAEIEEALTVSR